MTDPGSRSSVWPTACGVGAMLFWSSTIAVVRTLSEAMGPIHSAAWVYLFAGAVCAVWLLASGRLRRTLALPRRYLIGCGVPFAAYIVLLHLAVGLPNDRAVAAEVLLINYLWPPLVVLFSLPIQGNRARWTLLPGLALTLAGLVVGVGQAKGLSWLGFAQRLGPNLPYYLLALAAAVSWGLYSNLNRRLKVEHAGDAIPLFILADGIVLWTVHLMVPARAFAWSLPLASELAYLVAFPTLLAYTFWDIAMRRGNFMLVAVLSYTTPLLALCIASLRWGEAPAAGVWVGGALIVAGAIVCKLSVREAQPRPLAAP